MRRCQWTGLEGPRGGSPRSTAITGKSGEGNAAGSVQGSTEASRDAPRFSPGTVAGVAGAGAAGAA